jgi:hypothetical protein
MKAILIGILAGAMLCAVSIAQNPGVMAQTPSNSGQGNPATPRIAPGSVIPVELTKSIDAKKVKTGDEVEAKVTQDLKADSGEIIIPKDTKVLGHITQAQVRNKEQRESQVGIAFDHAVTKSGESIPLSMSIQAVIAPLALRNDNNPGSESPGQPYSAQAAPGGRATGSGAGGMSPAPNPSGNVEGPTGGAIPASPRPSITGATRGVVGISNLNLSSGESANQGSVVSSEKTNVKLDGGVLMLLRVNQ